MSPRTALEAGLRVDLDALPRKLRAQLKRGRVDLDDPAATAASPRLVDVVDHYDSAFALALSAQEKADLVEFLKSL